MCSVPELPQNKRNQLEIFFEAQDIYSSQYVLARQRIYHLVLRTTMYRTKKWWLGCHQDRNAVCWTYASQRTTVISFLSCRYEVMNLNSEELFCLKYGNVSQTFSKGERASTHDLEMKWNHYGTHSQKQQCYTEGSTDYGSGKYTGDRKVVGSGVYI